MADKAGVYVAYLVVNDGSKDSNTAFVTITTAEQTAAPVANAGSNQNVKVNTVVTLDGSFSSDANRDPLVYTWKFESMPSGSTAVLSSTTRALRLPNAGRCTSANSTGNADGMRNFSEK